MAEKRGSGLGHMVNGLFNRGQEEPDSNFISTEQNVGEVHEQLKVLQKQLADSNSEIVKLSPLDFLLYLQDLASKDKIDVS